MTNNRFKAEGIMEKGYGFIAKKVMKDKDLSIEAKAIYAYLSSYTGAGNVAYPSVSLMCGDLKISEARFYNHRKILEKKGYIVIEKHRNDKGWQNNVYTLPFVPTPQNLSTQNLSTRNLSTRNVGTKSNSSKSNSSKSNNKTSVEKLDDAPYKEIVNYLNEQTGSNFSPTAKATQRHINGRLSDGHTIDDFKYVIDVKVKEWGDRADMKQYLRPQTLFNTKFESYLNQDMEDVSHAEEGTAADLFDKVF